METIEIPERAMVVIPHPDDAEVGCGGTVARWAKEGTEVYFVLCTDGRAGSSDPNMTQEHLVELREQEQAQAAQVLGVREVVYLRNPDGHLADSQTVLGEVVKAIRRFRPNVVLSTDPLRRTSHQHRDHRAAGQASLDACFPYARDRLHLPGVMIEEELPPHKVGTVLLWGADTPEVFVDITDTIALKVSALRQHVSQFGPRRGGGFSRMGARAMGERAGCLYAEGFRRINFRT